MSRKLALIVGNSIYDDSQLAGLVTPDADVAALAEVLNDPEIGGFDVVDTAVNQSSSEIALAIARFFSEKRRDDMLLLYFSGHGILDSEGNLYLAARNTDRKLITASALSASFISREMDRSQSKRQVLILDCCHSGAFARGAKGTPGATVGTAAAFEGAGYGRAILTASDSTQYSWEGDNVEGQGQGSIFTRHLVEGLKSGAADTDGDGRITLDEVYEYVYEKVRNETPDQTPHKWSYKQEGELLIARNPNPVVKPAKLPTELIKSAESSLRWEREGAVRELAQLCHGSDKRLAAAAVEVLCRMIDDDSRRVSQAAQDAIGTTTVIAVHGQAANTATTTEPYTAPPPTQPDTPTPIAHAAQQTVQPPSPPAPATATEPTSQPHEQHTKPPTRTKQRTKRESSHVQAAATAKPTTRVWNLHSFITLAITAIGWTIACPIGVAVADSVTFSEYSWGDPVLASTLATTPIGGIFVAFLLWREIPNFKKRFLAATAIAWAVIPLALIVVSLMAFYELEATAAMSFFGIAIAGMATGVIVRRSMPGTSRSLIIWMALSWLGVAVGANMTVLYFVSDYYWIMKCGHIPQSAADGAAILGGFGSAIATSLVIWRIRRALATVPQADALATSPQPSHGTVPIDRDSASAEPRPTFAMTTAWWAVALTIVFIPLTLGDFWEVWAYDVLEEEIALSIFLNLAAGLIFGLATCAAFTRAGVVHSRFRTFWLAGGTTFVSLWPVFGPALWAAIAVGVISWANRDTRIRRGLPFAIAWIALALPVTIIGATAYGLIACFFGLIISIVAAAIAASVFRRRYAPMTC